MSNAIYHTINFQSLLLISCLLGFKNKCKHVLSTFMELKHFLDTVALGIPFYYLLLCIITIIISILQLENNLTPILYTIVSPVGATGKESFKIVLLFMSSVKMGNAFVNAHGRYGSIFLFVLKFSILKNSKNIFDDLFFLAVYWSKRKKC